MLKNEFFLNFYTGVRNTNSAKVGHTHDDRYYTEEEIKGIININNTGGLATYYNFENQNFSITVKVNNEWARILNFSNTGMWLSLKHTVNGTSTETVLWSWTAK